MNTKEIIIRQVVGLDAHSSKLEFSIWNITDGFNLQEAKPSKVISGEVNSLESIINNHTIEGAEIVIEASTSTYTLARRIDELGRRAIIVKSDTVKNFSPQYKITDKTDAANLARVWISGVAATVYRPTKKEQTYRAIARAYNNAVKDSTRMSNRIWAFCSENGLSLPKNGTLATVERVLEESYDILSAEQIGILDDLIWRLKNAQESEVHYGRIITTIVMKEPMMQRLLQVLGVGAIIAFTLVAFIGDINRFENPKKLCAYIGLVPSINASGKKESKNHRVSRTGIPIAKSMLIQGAQAGIRHGKSPMYKWARHIAAKNQCCNIGVVALARKMLVHIWHIMKGHTITYGEMPKNIIGKADKMASKLGKELRTKLGYKTAKELSNELVEAISAHFIVTDSESPSS